MTHVDPLDRDDRQGYAIVKKTRGAIHTPSEDKLTTYLTIISYEKLIQRTLMTVLRHLTTKSYDHVLVVLHH